MSKPERQFSTDHLQEGLRVRALRGATVTIVAQSVNFGLQTVGTLILAHILTPNDFGLITMVLTFSLLLQNFGFNGFTEAIIQAEAINHKQMSNLFWINSGFCFALALLFAASAPLIVWFYREHRLYPIIFALSFSIVFAGLSTEHLAILKRDMRFGDLSVLDVVSTAISIIAPIFLALHGCGYWSLVAKWLLAPLVITIGAWWLCSWRPGKPAKHTNVGSLLRYAFHTYGNFATSYLRRNVDKMLVGRFLGTRPLGNYDRAYQLSSVLPTQIINPIYMVALSTFSKLTTDPARYRQTFLKVLEVLAFVGMSLSAVLTLASKDLILLLLGPQWTQAGQIFFAFGISVGVMIIYITHGWLHLSLGTPDRWFRWAIVELAATVVLFGIGLPFGATGVAFAYSASFYLLLGPALSYAGKPINLTFSSVASRLWRYFVSALVAGIACWILLHVFPHTAQYYVGFHIVVRIGSASILCLGLYFLTIVVLFRGLAPFAQFLSLAREIMIQRRPS